MNNIFKLCTNAVLLSLLIIGSLVPAQPQLDSFNDRKFSALQKIKESLGDRYRQKLAAGKSQTYDTRSISAPQIGVAFDAFSRFDSVVPFFGNSFPNSGSFGVGPQQVATFSYYAVRSFDKNGTPDNILDVSGTTFFSPAGTLPDVFLADTIAQYDHWSQRWFFVSNSNSTTQSPTAPSFIYLAFSDGPIITNRTQWTYYSFDVSQIPPVTGRTSLAADYPKMGIDQVALYIGYDEFDNNDFDYLDATLLVIPKAPLFAGTPVVNSFKNLLTQYGTFFPTGVNNFDPNPQVGYGLSLNIFTGSEINLFIVNNPESNSPTLTVEFIPITPFNSFFAQGIGAPHKGSLYTPLGDLEFLGNACNSAFIRNNHLFMAFDAGVDSTGNTASLNLDRTGILWFELDLDTNPISIVQNGVIFDPAETNPLWFIWSGIMGNKNGDLVVASSVCGADSYANMMIAGRKAADPAGQMSAPLLVTNSPAPINQGPSTVNLGVMRFGEQTTVVLDPSDELTMWASAEWVRAQDEWASRVVQILPS